MKRGPLNSVAFMLDGVKESLDELQLAKINAEERIIKTFFMVLFYLGV